jgi:biofilm PGA synthesis lipoprotein PgaB
MPITITLDDGADHAKQSLQNMSRILVKGNM